MGMEKDKSKDKDNEKDKDSKQRGIWTLPQSSSSMDLTDVLIFHSPFEG